MAAGGLRSQCLHLCIYNMLNLAALHSPLHYTHCRTLLTVAPYPLSHHADCWTVQLSTGAGTRGDLDDFHSSDLQSELLDPLIQKWVLPHALTRQVCRGVRMSNRLLGEQGYRKGNPALGVQMVTVYPDQLTAKSMAPYMIPDPNTSLSRLHD